MVTVHVFSIEKQFEQNNVSKCLPEWNTPDFCKKEQKFHFNGLMSLAVTHRKQFLSSIFTLLACMTFRVSLDPRCLRQAIQDEVFQGDPSKSFNPICVSISKGNTKSSVFSRFFSETKARRLSRCRETSRRLSTWRLPGAWRGCHKPRNSSWKNVAELYILWNFAIADNILMCLRVNMSSPSFQKDLLSWFNDSNYNDKMISLRIASQMSSWCHHCHLWSSNPTAVQLCPWDVWSEVIRALAHHGLGARTSPWRKHGNQLNLIW